MSSKQFKEAAVKASFDVRTEYAPLLATCRVVISESSANKVTEIIESSYSEIEALFELLVKLAKLVNMIDDKYDPFEKKYVGVDNAIANRIEELLSDPRIAELVGKVK